MVTVSMILVKVRGNLMQCKMWCTACTKCLVLYWQAASHWDTKMQFYAVRFGFMVQQTIPQGRDNKSKAVAYTENVNFSRKAD